MKRGFLPRIIRSAYRKERVSSFIVIAGTVDAVIGGVGDRSALFLLGLGAIGVAAIVRWWRIQQSQVEVPEQSPVYYLPSQSSRPKLPMLQISHKHPPR